MDFIDKAYQTLKEEREKRIRAKVLSYELLGIDIIKGSDLYDLTNFTIPIPKEESFFEFLPYAQDAYERLKLEKSNRINLLSELAPPNPSQTDQ